MANKKKLTMKEVERRLDFLLKQLVAIQTVTGNMNKIVAFYIEYNKHVDGFRKYLEDKNNESGTSDSEESLEGNEGIDTGKQSVEGRKPETKIN